MSEVSSSYDSYDASGNKFSTIEEYFGTQVSVDDVMDMSEDERETYFTQLYAGSNITEEEFKEFLTKFEDECEVFYDKAYIAHRELEAILDSGNLTVAESATIELLMADLSEMMDALGDEFSSEWGEAQQSSEYLNRTVEGGATETIDLNSSDATEGSVIKVDASTGKVEDAGSEFDFGTKAEGYVDKDDDGVLEEGEIWNNDFDTNKDGAITEADDPTFTEGFNSNTVVISGDIASVELSSYDDSTEPVVATFKVTKESGEVVYIEIKGDCKIVCSPVPANYESLPQDLSQRMFEFTNSKQAYSNWIDGTSANDDIEYFTTINTMDAGNVANTTVSEVDINNERNITINCESGAADSLTLNVPDDAVINITQGTSPDQIILTLTVDGKVSTVTINNFDVNSSGTVSDTLNINGGTITGASYTEFNGWTQGSTFLSNFVYLNGLDITTDGDNNGANWDGTFTPTDPNYNRLDQDEEGEGNTFTPTDPNFRRA